VAKSSAKHVEGGTRERSNRRNSHFALSERGLADCKICRRLSLLWSAIHLARPFVMALYVFVRRFFIFNY